MARLTEDEIAKARADYWAQRMDDAAALVAALTAERDALREAARMLLHLIDTITFRDSTQLRLNDDSPYVAELRRLAALGEPR